MADDKTLEGKTQEILRSNSNRKIEVERARLGSQRRWQLEKEKAKNLLGGDKQSGQTFSTAGESKPVINYWGSQKQLNIRSGSPLHRPKRVSSSNSLPKRPVNMIAPRISIHGPNPLIAPSPPGTPKARRKTVFQDLHSIKRMIKRKSIYDHKMLKGGVNETFESSTYDRRHSSIAGYTYKENRIVRKKKIKCLKRICCLSRCCKKKKKEIERPIIQEISQVDTPRHSLKLDDPELNRFATMSPKTKSEALSDIWVTAISTIMAKQRIVNMFKKPTEKEKKPKPVRKRLCLIMPSSAFKLAWTFVVVTLLLYTAIVTPFIISFIDEMPTQLFIIEIFVDSLFFLDIIFTFFTPYEKGDKLITCKIKIAQNYITGWLLPDLLACFPFWAMEEDTSGTTTSYNRLIRLFRLSRLSRLVRLLRLTRIAKILPWTAEMVEKLMIMIKVHAGSNLFTSLGVGRLLRALVKLVFMIHLFSCLFFFLAKLEQFHPDTWVVRLGLLDASIFTQYLFSLYWVFQTMTTVGFGDVPPKTNLEIVMSLFVMGIGVGTYSYMMGNTSSILSHIDGRKRKLQEKIIALIEFSKQVKLPLDLTLRIKHHLENEHTNVLSSIEQESLLKDLPTSLRADILSHTHKSLIKKIYFLKGKSSKFLWKILPLMKPIKMNIDDFVFREGDIADEIFFILNGSVRFVDNTGHIFKIYSEGNYFGEIDILEHQSRSYSAIADEESDLVLIKKVDYIELLGDYPEILDQVEEMAEIRKTEYKIEKRSAIKMEKSERQSIMKISDSSNVFNQQFLKNQNKPKYKKAGSLKLLSINIPKQRASSTGVRSAEKEPLTAKPTHYSMCGNSSKLLPMDFRFLIEQAKKNKKKSLLKKRKKAKRKKSIIPLTHSTFTETNSSDISSEDESYSCMSSSNKSNISGSEYASTNRELVEEKKVEMEKMENIKRNTIFQPLGVIKDDVNANNADRVEGEMLFHRGMTFADGGEEEKDTTTPQELISLNEPQSLLIPSLPPITYTPQNNLWAHKVDLHLHHPTAVTEYIDQSPNNISSSRLKLSTQKKGRKYKIIDFKHKTEGHYKAESDSIQHMLDHDI